MVFKACLLTGWGILKVVKIPGEFILGNHVLTSEMLR